ncbi:MAG: VanW family protein [Deltaproteobacteria bacterium]
MKYKITAAVIAALLILLFAGVFYNSGKIKHGVKIEGISFSGYSLSTAESKLNNIYGKKGKDYKIILSYGNKTWEIKANDININYDTRAAANNAYDVGRTKGFFENIYDSIALLISGKNIQVPVDFNRNMLNQKLQVIAKEINAPAKNAWITVDSDGRLIKNPDKPGVKMDSEKTINLIKESISVMPDQSIKIAVIKDKPKYTMNDIKNINGEIGRAETIFNQGQANRASNIRNALAKINGTIMLDGEVFSLNQVLGPRVSDNGYKDAPVILNDELVPGMGGGVCQVATTLYKASLQGCLQIIERKHHSFPPVYIPAGQDATIAGDYIDFKMKNNLKSTIFIRSINKGNKIVVSLYSQKPDDGRKVKIESQVLEVVEPGPQQIIKDGSLESGAVRTERAEKKGYKVAVFRNIYINNNLLKRELISSDVYRPIRGIIRVGTGQKRITQEVIQNVIPSIDDIQNEFIEEPDNPPEMN